MSDNLFDSFKAPQIEVLVKMDIFSFAAVTSICKAFYWKYRGTAETRISSCPAFSIFSLSLSDASLWRASGKPISLSFSEIIWHLWMCLGILCIAMCNRHPHWCTESSHAEAGRVKHTSLHIHKHPLYAVCSKYNDCILAPFSSGWWQVFFPLTWLEWNPIISVMALQLFFCFEGVRLLESPLLDPNVLSKSVMRYGANVQRRQM